MISKVFLNALADSKTDVIEVFLRILEETQAHYCLIGDLAVNVYAEPVVSLDVDVVVAASAVERVCAAAVGEGFQVQRFEHSLNLISDRSDARIEIQTNPRCQEFLVRSTVREALGYKFRVAAPEDVLRGKVWAYSDTQRRRSKRQKDLADIMHLVETTPVLAQLHPQDIRDALR